MDDSRRMEKSKKFHLLCISCKCISIERLATLVTGFTVLAPNDKDYLGCSKPGAEDVSHEEIGCGSMIKAS
jgi:hypothetical protein